MSASDDMIENENEMLRDRVADLEKRVHDQNDEITCLRATLADCLRRINTLEVSKSHVQVRIYTINITLRVRLIAAKKIILLKENCLNFRHKFHYDIM